MRPSTRLDRVRDGSRLALFVATLSLAIATVTLGLAIHLAEPSAPRAGVPTGPVAVMQWQSTLDTAFGDIAGFKVDTLTAQGPGFGLAIEPDASQVAGAPARPAI